MERAPDPIALYWINHWPKEKDAQDEIRRAYISFLSGLVGLTSLDFERRHILVINEGPINSLMELKALSKTSLDPNHSSYRELGIVTGGQTAGDVLLVSGSLTDKTLPSSFFDLIFFNAPVASEQEACSILDEIFRLASPAAIVGLNLRIVPSPLDTQASSLQSRLADRDHSCSFGFIQQQFTLRGRITMPGHARSSRWDFVRFHYPLNIKPRWSLDSPNRLIQAKLQKNEDKYEDRLARYEDYLIDFGNIPTKKVDDRLPYWENVWMPALDGATIYAEMCLREPDYYIEIGSGNSTKFARHAITKHKLKTKIISIDPQPRAEIDCLCDEQFRCGLEDLDLSVFDVDTDNVILFFDGSHYCFSNTDVTVFFLELLPHLPSEWLIGVHDIILPYDYINPNMQSFNEQYILAPHLLYDCVETVFPSAYMSFHERYRDRIMALVPDPVRGSAWYGGAIYWFKRSGVTA